MRRGAKFILEGGGVQKTALSDTISPGIAGLRPPASGEKNSPGETHISPGEILLV
jgi:hypothetical protein